MTMCIVTFTHWIRMSVLFRKDRNTEPQKQGIVSNELWDSQFFPLVMSHSCFCFLTDFEPIWRRLSLPDTSLKGLPWQIPYFILSTEICFFINLEAKVWDQDVEGLFLLRFLVCILMSLCLHMVFALRLSSFSHKSISCIRWGPTLMTLFWFYYPFKLPVYKCSHILLEVMRLTYKFCGDTVQVIEVITC